MAAVITPEAIGIAITTAPAWAKLGLTVPQDRLRDDACREVAQHVYQVLSAPVAADRDQLALPL